jgi:hypothetical protein
MPPAGLHLAKIEYMPSYRIYRLKESQRQVFRWAPHTSGATLVKPRDYVEGGSVEAPGVYAAWAALRETEQAVNVGDLLETPTGELFICKYVGFEEAKWALSEEKDPDRATAPLRSSDASLQ